VRARREITLIRKAARIGGLIGPIGDEHVKREIALCGVHRSPPAIGAISELVGEMVASYPKHADGDEKEEGERGEDVEENAKEAAHR